MMRIFSFFFLLFFLFAFQPLSAAKAQSKNNVQKEIVQDKKPSAVDADLPTPHFQNALWRMLLILIIFIGLIWLTFWMIRKGMRTRFKQTNLSKSIKIIEKRTLSPKSMLYLVELENEKVLIAESQIEVRKLHSVEKKGNKEVDQNALSEN